MKDQTLMLLSDNKSFKLLLFIEFKILIKTISGDINILGPIHLLKMCMQRRYTACL